MNIFDEIISRLNSKSRIRSLFSDMDAEDMKRIIIRMNSVLDEKFKIKKLEKEQRKEKRNMIIKIQQTMKDNGLSLADFYEQNESISSSKRKTPREKYSFKYITLSGDTVFWYGSAVGRLPKPFQSYLDRTGKKRMDCIVNDSD